MTSWTGLGMVGRSSTEMQLKGVTDPTARRQAPGPTLSAFSHDRDLGEADDPC